MLAPHHAHEFTSSAIAPGIAELNFFSIDDPDFIRQWLNWKPHQKWKRCPFSTGWLCYSLDPVTGEARNWGPFKPDAPLTDTAKGKPRKYEHPAGYETLAILLQVDQPTWERIAQRYGIPIDFTETPHFWQWVWLYNLPIFICEGAKKAAALLSAGYVAIALPGVWNGRRKGKGDRPEALIPDLQHFATPGRQISFCFDYDPKFKTRLHVAHALVRTGKLFEQTGCTVSVIRLPGPEKGVDDFIVAHGVAAFEQLVLDAVSLEHYDRDRRLWMSGHRLSYPVDLDIKERYLLDGIAPLLTALQQGTLPALVAIASDMGTGKTELLARIRQIHPEARILNLGHRIALLRNLSKRIGTAIYSDYGWGMWKELCLSLTADSLYKLKTEGNCYDFVFLDEVEQFIEHVLCSDTCKEHRHEILQALRHFIYSAKHVILSDANLADVSIRFVQAMRPEPTEAPYVVYNRYRNGGRRVFWYTAADRSGIVQAIKQALYAGKKIIVSCDGLAFSKDLYEALQVLYPDLRIVCINSENSGESWAKELIENINEQIGTIDCLIYSPSVNTGVSIDGEHFDAVFGVFIGGALAGTDCLQGLNRNRSKIEWHVWVGEQPIGGYKPTSADRIQQQKLQANDLCGFLLGIVPGTGARVVQDEFAWDAWAALTARRHASLNNLRDDLRYWIEEQGHTIIEVGDATDAETKAELQQARSVNRHVWQQGVLTAERISATEARQLEAKERPTLDDRYRLERYRIETSWGKPVDAELIELDQGGRTIRQLMVLESLIEPAPDAQVVQGKRIFFPPEGVAMRDRKEREQFHGLDWRNYSVSWLLRVELGLPALLSVDREFRNDAADLVELAAKAQRNAALIKDFLGITLRKEATPVQILRQLLEQAGLKLVCDRRVGGRGDQVRVYRIDAQCWQIAMEVLEYRRNKRQMQTEAAVELAEESVVTGGVFGTYINKRASVTTELEEGQLSSAEPEGLSTAVEPPLLSPADMADAIELISMAVELDEIEVLQALWGCWDEQQQQQLRAIMPEALTTAVDRRIAEQVLQLPPATVVPGAIVRWLGQVGDWVVRSVSAMVATVVQSDRLGLERQVPIWALQQVGSLIGSF